MANKSLKYRLLIAGMTAAIGFTPGATFGSWAQEADDETPAQRTLETVTITATKRSESLQNVAVSVSAFGEEAIERLNPGDSTELAAQVPGLEIRSNAGATNANIFLRGVGSTGISFNLQSGVGTYSDEVALNSPVVNILQVFDLERVEVLRGPQNTLYGRNTTGGAINYISRKPEVGGAANGYLTGTYGSFNQTDLAGAFGAPLGENVAVRGAFQYQARDGVRENQLNGQDVGDRDKFAVRGQLAWEPSDNLSFLLKAHAERVRSGNTAYKTVGGFDPADLTSACATPDTLGACAASDGFQDTSDPEEVFLNLTDPRNDVDASGASLTATVDFESFTLTSITAFEENEQVLSEDSDGTPSSGFHFFLDNEQEQFSQEIRLTSNGSGPLSWILGGYFFSESLEGQTGPLFATPMGTMLVQSFAEFDNTTYSAYGEAEYDVSDQLTLKGGVRFGTDEIEGQTAALLAFESFLPGVDLNQSLLGGAPLPSFQTLADIATANGVATFTGGAVGGGPNRLILVGGATDPTAQINDTSFDEWGGTAGIDYNPTEDVLLYAKWSRGFKAGRFNAAPMSIMNLDGDTGRSLGDTPVEPEIVNAYEVGIKSQFADNRVRLNAAAFYYDYKDQQINQFVNGAFTVLNADSEILGAEVEANIAPGNNFFLDLGASILDSEVDNPTNDPGIGGVLPQAPDFTFNFAARKEWDLDNGSLFTLGFDGNYVDDRFFELANAAGDDGYFVTNAQASYVFGDDRQYRVALFGKNIFDEEYFLNRFANGSQIGPDTVLLGDPATYGVTFKVDW